MKPYDEPIPSAPGALEHELDDEDLEMVVGGLSRIYVTPAQFAAVAEPSPSHVVFQSVAPGPPVGPLVLQH